MGIYILSDPKKSGGVFQWEKQIKNCTISYELISNIKENDIIYVNNYSKSDFFNKLYLKKLKEQNVNLYFVVHSDLCPMNKLFVMYMEYFKGAISTNKCVFNKINKLYPTLHNIYILNTIDDINTLNNTHVIEKKNIYKLHFVGRISPEKNLPMLFNALIYVNNIILNIYGETQCSYCAYLKYLCKYFKLENRIFFIGFCENKELLYKNADAIILPSVHEGLPYCLLEATSFNIPVIFNDISQISQHIDNKITTFTYDGYSSKLNDVLYVDNYSVLLKMIGYIDYKINVQDMIALNKCENIKYKTLKKLIESNVNFKVKINVGSTYLIPPFLLNKQNQLFSHNVNKIKNSLLSFLK